MSEKTNEELIKELEELRNEREQALASKRRVEEENAKYKKRAQDVESKLSEAEKQKLEDEGKLRELLEKEREEKATILKTHESLRDVTLREKLTNAVRSNAKDAIDVNDILRVVEAKDALKIDYDTLTIDGVEDFVTKVRELKPHYFAKKKTTTGEDLPPNVENGKGETKDELYQKELKGAKNQREFDEIRKKYGKNIY